MNHGLLTNTVSLITCRREGTADLHAVDDGAMAWENGTIVWVGRESDVPEQYRGWPKFDAKRCLVVPGLVDCHTHLAFGGWRADEFAERARGVSYLEIARRGGGILKTVEQTRAATHHELLDHSRSFMRKMIRLGVTTIECKSGYGLTVADELKLLRVYDALRSEGPARIVSTCLGAHVVPQEFRDNRRGYIDLLCAELIPEVARQQLASFFDAFVEDGAFTRLEAIEILETAKRHGMRAKLHVDQLADSGGGSLAASVEAISADHLEYVSDSGIDAMERINVVPVALPIASLYLRQSPLNARRFLDRGIPVAVATDFNPGSAPTFDLPLAMTLSATMNRMTPAEVLKGVTITAAAAVALDDRVGSLEPGKAADFVLVDSPTVDHWIYQFAPGRISATVIGGRTQHVSDDFADVRVHSD